MPLQQVQSVGGVVTDLIAGFGRFSRFCAQTVRWAVGDVSKPHRWRLVWPQMYEVGTRSIPVVMLTGAFIGMVLAIELFEQFEQFGQGEKLGGVIGLSVVKHLGPVMAAVMLAGRVGGAFAAELGTMTVTEQVEALRVMGTAPVSYLVVPRVVACLVMIPILTVFSDLLGVSGGWLITVGTFHVTNHQFWSYTAQFIGPWDVFSGLSKSMCFGVAIAMISCYKGFSCSRGAQGVGKATTSAFVASFVTIMILNFFLAKFGNDLYRFLYGIKPVLIG